MKIKTKFYIVIDTEDNSLWEKAYDFSSSRDYYPKEISEITKKDLMTLKEATKFRDEIDKELSSFNDLTFIIKNVEIIIK